MLSSRQDAVETGAAAPIGAATRIRSATVVDVDIVDCPMDMGNIRPRSATLLTFGGDLVAAAAA